MLPLLMLLAAVAASDGHLWTTDFSDYMLQDVVADIWKERVIPLSRHKRDAESQEAPERCRMRRRKFCCADAAMEKMHERDRNAKKECFKEVYGDREPFHVDPFRCERAERNRRDAACVLQCVGQKNNFLDKEGDIIPDEFAKWIKESFSKEAWFSSIEDKVVSNCTEEVNNITTDYKNEEKSCNPTGIKLVHCVFREVQLGCPEGEIRDSKTCSRIRDRIRNRVGDGFQPPSLNEA